MIFRKTEESHKFELAYYRWALDQWSQEVESELPLLRAVNSYRARFLVQMLEPLPQERQIQIGRLLGMSCHIQAARELEPPLQPEERELIERINADSWKMYDREAWTRLARKMPNPAVWPLLKKEARGPIEEVLGTKRERLGRNSWYYRTPVGRWSIGTEIAFGSGGCDMHCAHDIDPIGAGGARLAYELGVMSCLGVSGNKWDCLSEEDVPNAVAGLVLVSRRFIESAPAFLPK